MPRSSEPLVVSRRLSIAPGELRWSFARSSGPGGQNVNKVNTKVTLRWAVTTSPSLPDDVKDRFIARYRSRLTSEGHLLLSSQRYRDQGRNLADCLQRLEAMLVAVAAPPKKRKATRPSRASVERRLKSKQAQSARKQLRRRPPSE